MNDGGYNSPFSEGITGLILAGGRSRRMHGSDKGLLLMRGLPLIGHVIGRLRPQVGPLLINANRNRQEYESFGFPVIADALDGHQGPLAGLAAGLNAARTEWVLAAPCDTPFLPADLVARLATAAHAAQRPVAMARSADGLQPLCSLVHRSLLDDLHGFLEQGQRQVRAWLERHGPAIAGFEDETAFVNVNAPGTLQQLEAVAC